MIGFYAVSAFLRCREIIWQLPLSKILLKNTLSFINFDVLYVGCQIRESSYSFINFKVFGFFAACVLDEHCGCHLRLNPMMNSQIQFH